jgi:lysyl-tRNA synthetase class 2
MPSAVIARLEYNADAQTLLVTYQSGSVYEYLHVPETVYKEMLTYRAKGVFLNRHIKKKYAFIKRKDNEPGAAAQSIIL